MIKNKIPAKYDQISKLVKNFGKNHSHEDAENKAWKKKKQSML